MIILLLSFFSLLIPPHTNLVGEVRIDNFENEIFLEAILDKRYLTLALMNEGDCEPQEMMSGCGNEYVLSTIELRVNSKIIPMEKQSMEIQKDFVVYRYYAGEILEGINKIALESDYMLTYHEHSILNVRLHFNNDSKHYSLHSKNKILTYLPN